MDVAGQQDLSDLVFLKIEGMKCGGCAKKIKGELELLSEVVHVETVDFQAKLAVVYTKPATPPFVLESSISKTGKKVENVQIVSTAVLSELSEGERAFILQVEPLKCSSCVRSVGRVADRLHGEVVHSIIEEKIVIVKLPAEVAIDKFINTVEEETGKHVSYSLELKLEFLRNKAQVAHRALNEHKEDAEFHYVFYMDKKAGGSNIGNEWIVEKLGQKFGMINIQEIDEQSHLLFAESQTKIEAVDWRAFLKEYGIRSEWFLCYEDQEMDLVDSQSSCVHIAHVGINPVISCPHCKNKIVALLNSASYIEKVEFLDNVSGSYLKVELDSIRGFYALERILRTFGRTWIPTEAISTVANRVEDMPSFNVAKELVIDCSNINISERDKLSKSVASLTGVFYIQKNYSASLKIVFSESITSESELLRSIASFGYQVERSGDCIILSSVGTMEDDSRNNETDEMLTWIKKYNCGCQKPNCCCLSLPLSESEDDSVLSFTEILFKDSGSPRAVEELATYLSCGSCHGNKKSCLLETEQKIDKEEIGSSIDNVDGLCPNDAFLPSSSYTTDPKYQKNEHTCKLTANISGMSCASCVGAIENRLKQYDGIVSISIGLITTKANIEFVPDKISPDEIKIAIESLGYEVSSLKVVSDNEGKDSEKLVLEVAESQTADTICKILQEQSQVDHLDKELVSGSMKQGLLRQQFPLSLFFPTSTKSQYYQITVHFNQSEVTKWKSTRSKEYWSDNECVNPKIRLVRLLNSRNLEFSLVNENTDKNVHQSQMRQRLEVEANNWLLRFIVAAAFTVPLMIFSFGLSGHVRNVDEYLGSSRITIAFLVEWILATIVQLFGGYPFYRGSYFAIVRSHRPNMDVLIAVATSIIYIYSVASLIYYSAVGQSSHDIDFDSSAMLITIITFGKWLETLAKRNSAKGFEMFEELVPEKVTPVYKDKKGNFIETEVVSPELLMVGDIIKVLPGERLAVDGIIEAGEGSVDESAITGESLPVQKRPGDSVFSGTSNRNSILYVRTTAVYSQSTVSQILELVENAQNSHAPIESIADKISAYFVVTIVFLAALVFLIWALLTEESAVPSSWYDNQSPIIFSLVFAVSVVAVACPCALGLATPSAFMTASSVAVRYGILLKESAAVQYLYNAACIVFDKTGTLTCGKPKVFEIQQLNLVAGLDMDKMVSLIAQVESHSDHPYANAIVRYATEERGLQISKQVQSLEEKPGCGVESRVANHEVWIGNMKWIISKCCSSQEEESWIDKSHQQVLDKWMEDGSTVIVAAIDYIPCIAFRVHDELRPEAKQVVSFFREKNKLDCWLVTGDNKNTAFAVAKLVGIPVEKVVSQALPGDKVKIVETLIDKYRASSSTSSRVVFVGDGVNDGPALAAADVGVAMGSKNQLAAGAAGAIVMSDNLVGVATLFHLSRVTFRRILLNYLWAIVYNIVFVPGAAGAIFPVIRKQMPPWFAAILMASSSLTVSLSSLLLRFYRPVQIVD